MNIARAMDSLSATSLKRTSPAPTAASLSMNPRENSAAFRDACPRGRARNAHTARPTTSSKAAPLVRRWENSMIVSIFGARGTITPLHSGQWLPHPAPEPVARTIDPQRMTTTFQKRVIQA